MTTIENAARQALETLETISVDVKTTSNAYEAQRQAISALREALKQQQKCEPVAWMYSNAQGRTTLVKSNVAPYEDATPLYAEPPQTLVVERERNFCERCGKRLVGSDHIHTCTPPQPAPQAAIEQQPVAWRWLYNGKSDGEKCFPMPGPDHDVIERAAAGEFPRTVQYLCAIQQPKSPSDDWVPLYPAPPKRESLTDEQIDSIMQPLTQNTAYSWRAFARAIESAHGIKETVWQP